MVDHHRYHVEVSKMCGNIEPTRYKISTITATGDVNANLNLEVLFAKCPLTPPVGQGYGFSSVQYSMIMGDDKVATLMSRTAVDVDGRLLPTQRSARRKRRPVRHFDNQCTLIYWEHERLEKGIIRGVNVKCFRNGRIQMTGVREVIEGIRIMDRLVETFSGIKDLIPPKEECLVSFMRDAVEGHCDIRQEDDNLVISESSSTFFVSNYKVCLINSDFNLNFFIKRDILHVLLCNASLVCAFEPCIYPGVKLSFMWNHVKTSKNEVQDGICYCPKKCRGKGDGYGPGDCRKITCAIFQSGCTIITGAHSYTQLEDTYTFVCTFASLHKDRILRNASSNSTDNKKK
jgi:hypothetical protein